MTFLAFLLLSPACTDVEQPHEENAEELITTVQLDFVDGAGATSTFTWSDPEADGSPVIDDVRLPAGGAWTLSISFLNALEEPAEDVTVEVEAEAEQHQVFLTGGAVEGPATGENPDAVIEHTYADEDENGFPVGLENSIVARSAGSGTLEITLRHLPPQNGSPVKTATLAEDAASGGLAGLPGEPDANVEFAVTVE